MKQMPPLLRQTSLRKISIAAITCIVTLAVIGWGFWSLAASQYRRVINERIEESKERGFQISYDSSEVFGFPRHITMRFTNLHSTSTSGIQFHTDILDIKAVPWNWTVFDIIFKKPVTISAPLDDAGHALTLSTAFGEAHLVLDNEGFWRQADLSLRDSKIGLSPTYLFSAGQLSASVARPDQPPKDHHEVGLTITGEADQIVLPDAMPSPFGTQAEKVGVHMRVMGQVPDVRKRASVDAWNKESGVVEFDVFSANWGVLNVAAKGTLGFDDDLQPEGAFIGLVADPEKTFMALIEKGFIAMHDQNMLESAMSLLAKPSAGGKGTELPITIQLGGLFMGPVKIFSFPAIEWPQEPPPVK